MVPLNIGYFEDFNAERTLLLEGDAESLAELVEALSHLADGRREAITLHEQPFVKPHGGVKLAAELSRRDVGIGFAGHGTSFLWKRSRDGWLDVIEKIRVLIRATEGHHYLDGVEDEITIRICKDEYGADWWKSVH